MDFILKKTSENDFELIYLIATERLANPQALQAGREEARFEMIKGYCVVDKATGDIYFDPEKTDPHFLDYQSAYLGNVYQALRKSRAKTGDVYPETAAYCGGG